MTAFEKLVDALGAHGSTVQENGQGQARAQCPAHNDQNPSLSISPRSDGKGIILHCHAGCAYTDVLDALGLFSSDLFDDAQFQNAYRNTATYVYFGGRKVNRKPDKSFPQTGNKADRSLYHVEMIGSANVIYVPEGEKDVLAIEAVGGVAVCSAMGAGKAHLADWFPLTGKHVIIVADNDEPGPNHADDIAELLESVAATVTIFKAAVGKDPADHIAAGKTLAELVPVTGFADTTPIPLTGFVSLPSFFVDAFPSRSPTWWTRSPRPPKPIRRWQPHQHCRRCRPVPEVTPRSRSDLAGANRCASTPRRSPSPVNANRLCSRP